MLTSNIANDFNFKYSVVDFLEDLVRTRVSLTQCILIGFVAFTDMQRRVNSLVNESAFLIVVRGWHWSLCTHVSLKSFKEKNAIAWRVSIVDKFFWKTQTSTTKVLHRLS